MDLPNHIFDTDLLVPKLRSSDKIGAIKELVDVMYKANYVKDSLGFLQSVLEREDIESTVVEEGVAFPHARSRCVEKLGVAVGISPKGVDFRPEQDDAPVHLICLFAVPPSVSGSYLSLLSSLSKVLEDNRLKHNLAECHSANEINELFFQRMNG